MSYSGRVFLVVISAIVSLTGSFFLFYGGRYTPPALSLLKQDSVLPAPFPIQPFTDSPVKRKGTLVVDMTHFNNYSDQEISILLSRVSSRGFIIKLLGNVGEFMDSAPRRVQRENDLEVALRSADSYMVALPWYDFTDKERSLVRSFVGRGGKVLLVSDSVRNSAMNSLASDFGLIFEPDYLYNVLEHETNFQHFYVRSFRNAQISQGLKTVVFYQAGSISPESQGVAFTDENTFSSARESRGPFTPMSLAANGRVLAVSDLTFMTAPYNSVLDNDRLVSNIADFLTISERTFGLAEFPFFFKKDVDVVASSESLIGEAQSLRSLLSGFERVSVVKSEESFLNETAFLGLWQDYSKVEHYLSSAGIVIGKTIQTPFTGDIPAEGTALLYLDRSQERNVLIVLGDTDEAVGRVIDMLGSGEFRQGLVSDRLGIYRQVERVITPTPRPSPTATPSVRR